MGMTRVDFQRLTEVRLHEAHLLLQHGSPSGAYYLAGYAVESALKARIAGLHSRSAFPSKADARWVYTHNLLNLLRIAGLDRELMEFSARQPAFDANWALVLEWSEESRYALSPAAQTRALLSSIQDETTGVLPWIKARW